MALLTRTSALSGFYELVARLGGKPEKILQRFNIAPGKIKELEGVLPFSTKIQLIEEAARELDCPDFGFRLAAEQKPTLLGPVAAMALNAPTVGDALDKILQYLPYQFATRAALEREKSGGLAYLKIDLERALTKHRQNLEQALGFANNTLKMLYGSHFRARSVLIRAASPLPHGRYQDYLGAPVHFGCDCDALVLDAEQLQKGIDHSDPLLHSLLDQYVNDALPKEPLNLIHQVEQLILRLLSIQRCSLQTVANQLGLHKRTLQRRLSEHSLVFEDILDTIRRKQAEDYLAQAGMSMTQIATLLGYREQSSFNRACRRWFGATPLEIRKQLLGKATETETEPV